MSGLKVAAQMYTVREHTQNGEDFRQTVHKLKELGYNAVQVSAIGPIAPEVVKEAADSAGVAICATHTKYDRLESELDKVIAEHKLWGCDFVGVGAMPPAYRKDAAGYRRFANDASEIGRRLKDQGLQLIYHNHSFEFRKFDGEIGLDILFNESDPSAFGFEIDTYWIQHGGADPVQWINKVAGRMQVVHFKDLGIADDSKPAMMEVGQGNLNWEAIIAACKNTGVVWAAVEQDVCPGDPFDSLAISRRNLAALGLKD